MLGECVCACECACVIWIDWLCGMPSSWLQWILITIKHFVYHFSTSNLRLCTVLCALHQSQNLFWNIHRFSNVIHYSFIYFFALGVVFRSLSLSRSNYLRQCLQQKQQQQKFPIDNSKKLARQKLFRQSFIISLQYFAVVTSYNCHKKLLRQELKLTHFSHSLSPLLVLFAHGTL